MDWACSADLHAEKEASVHTCSPSESYTPCGNDKIRMKEKEGRVAFIKNDKLNDS